MIAFSDIIKREVASFMARRAFYSFHFEPDNWRASQVRNIGAIEGNSPASDNDWEAVKKGGDAAIQRWIDGQLSGRGCTIVLIGSATAGRKWINYEIEKSWNDAKGVVGVYIHHLKDRNGQQSVKGANPFDGFTMKRDNRKLSSNRESLRPSVWESTATYEHIKNNLASLVEKSIFDSKRVLRNNEIASRPNIEHLRKATMYCSVSERTTSKLCSTCLMVTGKPKRFAPRWMSLATRLTSSRQHAATDSPVVSLQRGFFGGVGEMVVG